MEIICKTPAFSSKTSQFVEMKTIAKAHLLGVSELFT
jgi:hypothetical protein